MLRIRAYRENILFKQNTECKKTWMHPFQTLTRSLWTAWHDRHSQHWTDLRLMRPKVSFMIRPMQLQEGLAYRLSWTLKIRTLYATRSVSNRRWRLEDNSRPKTWSGENLQKREVCLRKTWKETSRLIWAQRGEALESEEEPDAPKNIESQAHNINCGGQQRHLQTSQETY